MYDNFMMTEVMLESIGRLTNQQTKILHLFVSFFSQVLFTLSQGYIKDKNWGCGEKIQRKGIRGKGKRRKTAYIIYMAYKRLNNTTLRVKNSKKFRSRRVNCRQGKMIGYNPIPFLNPWKYIIYSVAAAGSAFNVRILDCKFILTK